MWKNLFLMVVSLLPLRAESACTGKDLQGRYVTMAAFESSGSWRRCTTRINAAGIAVGSCIASAADIVPTSPVQLSISPSCLVSGTSQDGVFSFSLRMQRHKRGMVGRIRSDDGENVLEGPLVAVKLGK